MNCRSAPLARLQERCRPLLQQFVQALFDHADDALFELADRAVNNAEQNMYFRIDARSAHQASRHRAEIDARSRRKLPLLWRSVSPRRTASAAIWSMMMQRQSVAGRSRRAGRDGRGRWHDREGRKRVCRAAGAAHRAYRLAVLPYAVTRKNQSTGPGAAVPKLFAGDPGARSRYQSQVGAVQVVRSPRDEVTRRIVRSGQQPVGRRRGAAALEACGCQRFTSLLQWPVGAGLREDQRCGTGV